MLPRQQRLTHQTDFKRVYVAGKGASGRLLRIRYCETKSPTTRFGIVVANTVSKRATVRNTIKRRLREVVRQLYVNTRLSRDIVISATPRAVGVSSIDLRQELTTLLTRTHLLQQPATSV